MKFRKKPVIVEAVQFDGRNDPHGVFRRPEDDTPYVVTIHDQRAYLSPNDWVITEPDGVHHYPCKPDIFDATYQAVAEAGPTSEDLERAVSALTEACTQVAVALDAAGIARNLPLPERVKLLAAERDQHKVEYRHTCELVAKMHAAATGKPGDGPNRGVVEDVEDVRVERDRLKAKLELARGKPLEFLAELGFAVDERGEVQLYASGDAKLTARAATLAPPRVIDIVFDGPPGPTAGRFVEVEEGGKSIAFGEWVELSNGPDPHNVPLWALRFTLPVVPAVAAEGGTAIATAPAELQTLAPGVRGVKVATPGGTVEFGACAVRGPVYEFAAHFAISAQLEARDWRGALSTLFAAGVDEYVLVNQRAAEAK